MRSNCFRRTGMRYSSLFLCLAILLKISPGAAAVDPAATTKYTDHAVAAIHQWQRIDFRPERSSSLAASQIRVAIQTQGLNMQGLIRIPGAPASNFDTGRGLTIVDLINVGDKVRGYAEIVALEIMFTQATLGQYYQVFPVDYGCSN